MNAPSIDIVDMLEADSSLGLICGVGGNLFVAKEPPNPDNTVTIFDTFGYPPYMGLTDVGYEYPSIQIRVRNRDYRTGWNLANEIMTALHGRAHETWNGALYQVIYATNGPALLDWDDNGRVRLIINFNLQRR
jgi:hypothetical protein